ncbi:hypothetical protein B0H13DRAFT_2333246 [Mycena leptocephala]|nr:hypothetical protein B0H13DRAFT_2333246 [Mycena leptocephala]
MALRKLSISSWKWEMGLVGGLQLGYDLNTVPVENLLGLANSPPLPWVVEDFPLEPTLSPELANTRKMLIEFTKDPKRGSDRTPANTPLTPPPRPSLDQSVDQRASVIALAAALELCCPSHIRGVNWTGNGNLVIHPRAPSTASQLASIHVIDVVQRECGNFSGPAVLEADTPWVQLVEGVPAQPRRLVTSLPTKSSNVAGTLP